jgi:hypothetical protein
MKPNTTPVLAALILGCCSVLNAEQTVIAISPALPDLATKNDVYKSILTAALSDIAPGDSIQILDGWEVKSVATLTVPSHQAYARDPKARAKAMQPAIQVFSQWLTTESTARNSIPANGLRVPAIFEFCATHTDLATAKGRLVLVGSTIYDDPSEPAFSMKDGYYPSDAHLAVARQESVFGLKDGANRLEGVVVHWASVGAQYQDDGNRAAVERWWSLFCQTQGCILASCDSAAATVFQRFKTGSRTPIVRASVEADHKLEMRHAPIRIRVPSSAQAPQPVDTSTPAPPELPAPAAGPDINFMLRQDISQQPLEAQIVENCRIGIRWPGDCDIDLYVRPMPSSEELFYGHQRTREGIHVKDWLTSPDVDNNGFETVELRGRVDLSKLTVGINFYAGKPQRGGVNGQIRIETGGKVFQSDFHVRASTGNRGSDGSQRASSPYWVILDPLVITKQR